MGKFVQRTVDLGMVNEGRAGPSSLWFCHSPSANEQDEAGPAAEAGAAVKPEHCESGCPQATEEFELGGASRALWAEAEQELTPSPDGHLFLVCAQGLDYTNNKFSPFLIRNVGGFAHKQDFKHSKIGHTFSLFV